MIKKLFIKTEEQTFEVEVAVKNPNITKKKLFEDVKAYEESLGFKVLQIEYQRGHHLCPYCGSIAKGTDKDILCEDCRETFGHYSIEEL